MAQRTSAGPTRVPRVPACQPWIPGQARDDNEKSLRHLVVAAVFSPGSAGDAAAADALPFANARGVWTGGST